MYRRYIKRPLDITCSSLLLVTTAPIFFLVAAAIKLESKGPVIFRQTRTGLNGKPFTLYKFRSMAAHNNIYDNTSSDEVTRIGAFIRKTSIDELPQLINVIIGDMSFIGPRPWIPEYHKHMTAKQRRRHEVRPGITGLAQSRGRNALTIHEKINFDLRYASHLSLYEDLKVIFFTIVTLYDKSTLLIGKNGIHDEITELKNQHINQSAGQNG